MAADALSRYPFAQVNTVLDISVSHTIIERITNAYKEDPFFEPIVKNPQQYQFYKLA